MNVLRADDYDLKLNIEPKQQVNNKIKFINQRIMSMHHDISNNYR